MDRLCFRDHSLLSLSDSRNSPVSRMFATTSTVDKHGSPRSRRFQLSSVLSSFDDKPLNEPVGSFSVSLRTTLAADSVVSRPDEEQSRHAGLYPPSPVGGAPVTRVSCPCVPSCVRSLSLSLSLSLSGQLFAFSVLSRDALDMGLCHMRGRGRQLLGEPSSITRRLCDGGRRN